MIPFRKFVNIQKKSECSSYIPLMLILLPTFENTSDIFLNFVVDYQSEHPPKESPVGSDRSLGISEVSKTE